jgi:hypothetical protein
MLELSMFFQVYDSTPSSILMIAKPQNPGAEKPIQRRTPIRLEIAFISNLKSLFSSDVYLGVSMM